MTSDPAKNAARTHQAGVCDCVRCRHPLLVDLPPRRLSGAARRRLLARILDEVRPGLDEEEKSP